MRLWLRRKYQRLDWLYIRIPYWLIHPLWYYNTKVMCKQVVRTLRKRFRSREPAPLWLRRNRRTGEFSLNPAHIRVTTDESPFKPIKRPR